MYVLPWPGEKLAPEISGRDGCLEQWLELTDGKKTQRGGGRVTTGVSFGKSGLVSQLFHRLNFCHVQEQFIVFC